MSEVLGRPVRPVNPKSNHPFYAAWHNTTEDIRFMAMMQHRTRYAVRDDVIVDTWMKMISRLHPQVRLPK